MMNELARKDLLTCLGIWLALEIVGFGLLPAIGLGRSSLNIEPWLVASLPLGIGGAFLLSSSTQISSKLGRLHPENRSQTSAMKLSSFFLSWLGLIGIGFPLVITTALICVEIFSRLRG